MIPIVSAATGQYQDVFGVTTIPMIVRQLSLMAFGAFPFGIMLWGFSETLRSRRIFMTVVVISLLQAAIFLPFSVGQDNTLHDRINANLQQKYGASLDGNSDLPENDAGLSEAHKYSLVFPDGAHNEYTLRFDSKTSEPFIISGNPTAPSADQLNQNAKK